MYLGIKLVSSVLDTYSNALVVGSVWLKETQGRGGWMQVSHGLTVHRSTSWQWLTLRVWDIETISLDARGGDKIKCIKQRAIYWIYVLKAISTSGANEHFDPHVVYSQYLGPTVGSLLL